MEHIYEGVLLRSTKYYEYPDLMAALEGYIFYMIAEGYFPHGYSIFRLPDDTFVLLDFSRFGTVVDMAVRFKHYRSPIPMGLAHAMFGLVSFQPLFLQDWDFGGCDHVISRKIEEGST